MSTRKLIIASLICGLLILAAGSLKLFQTSSDSGESPNLFKLGTTVEMAGVRVTVGTVQVSADKTYVNVTMNGSVGDSPIAGWSMLANGEITTPLASTACPSAPREVTCVLEFVVAVGTPTIVFVRDGDKTQWLGS